MIYPDLPEALFHRNGEPGNLAHWTSSQALHEFLEALPALPAPPTMAPMVPGDPPQGYQTVSASSPYIVPGELSFEPMDAETPRGAAARTGSPVPIGVTRTTKEYKCRILGCDHISTNTSNRTTHEASKKHKPPGYICPEVSCAIKSQDEKGRSGTRCLPECEGNPCGGPVCQNNFTQKWSLNRHISECHTLVLLLGCPVVGCEMRAKRHGKKCDVHGLKVKVLGSPPV